MCVIYTKQPKVVGPALLVPFLQAVIKLTRMFRPYKEPATKEPKKRKCKST